MQRPTPHKLYLSDLTHGPITESICVRVMRKWTYDGNETGGSIRYIGLVLADEKGNAIYAENPPDSFPKYVYNITPYSEINPVYPSSTKYIDVLGIVTSVDNVVDQRVKNKERVIPMREILIKDLNDQELKVTLWAEHATTFNLPESSTSGPVHSIVVLFVGCLPKSIDRKTQLSGGNGCRWFFNPDIKEAQPYYDSLKKNPVPIYQPQPLDPASHEPVLPIILEHKTLDELNNMDPFEFPKQGCKCTVTIKCIPQEKRWWYFGCAKCKKSPKEETGTFWCAPCKCSESIPLYKFSFTATDDTAEAQFFAYDDAARNIIHRNVREVLNQLNKGSGFPQFLTDVISKKFTFNVNLTDDSFGEMKDRTYIVKSVAADHQVQAYKAKQQVLTQPTGDTSLTLTPIVSKEHIIQSSTPSNSANTVPDIMDTGGSSQQTPPPGFAIDDTPKRTELTRDTIEKEKSSAYRTLFPSSTDVHKAQTEVASNDATKFSETLVTDVTKMNIPMKSIAHTEQSTSNANTEVVKDSMTDEDYGSEDLRSHDRIKPSNLPTEQKAKKQKTDACNLQLQPKVGKPTSAKTTK